MAFYLDYVQAASKFINTATSINIAAGDNFKATLEIRKAGANPTIWGSSSVSSLLRFSNATTIDFRDNSNISIAGTVPDERTDFVVIEIERISGALTIKWNGSTVASGTSSQAIGINRIFASQAGVSASSMQLKYIEIEINGVLAHRLRNDTGTGTQLPDQVGSSTFNQTGTWPSDNSEWVFYESGTVTPITFTGTIPAQSATVGTPFSLNVSSYVIGNQTPFTYAIQSGTLPAGLTLSGSTISGTPTSEESQAITVRATDAASNTADSNSFTITVAAAASVPQGTVTIGTVTAAQTTASVPFTYSLSDQTGFQYRLNGGAAVATPSSPINLTGLTASTAYTIEVRATNAAGVGNWSAVTNFTTQAAPVVEGTITSSVFTNNTGQVLASVTGITANVCNKTNGNLVLSTTTSTNASGISVISNAAITTGTEYVTWYIKGSELAIELKTAT